MKDAWTQKTKEYEKRLLTLYSMLIFEKRTMIKQLII